ncbi:ABC transporter substrate-binding protein [Zhaonella formicivorans]|uniref:ABC transporter substrate-binding protein n=1 Tax=Zhaonella formicivorans TaxID=2528593 RepID=UPI0010E9971F|nr:ABC transporter substrate-binding protein [Zhaonella formicivorans]
MLKKGLWLALFVIALVLLGNCQEKKTTLGVIQIVSHPSLDAARQGFMDYLEESGFEPDKNILISYENAQGDEEQARYIVDKFTKEKTDLILAISTPSARAAISQNRIPVLFTAVTDPVGAGLEEKLNNSARLIAGVTDLTTGCAQLQLLRELLPETKTIGIIYNKAERYAALQVERLRESVADYNMTIITKEVENDMEAVHAAKNLLGEIDVLYLPTDKTVNSGLDEILLWAKLAKKPVFTGEAAGVQQGALAAVEVNYYKLGRQTGEMAVKLLKKEKQIAQLGVESSRDNDIFINWQTANELGIKVPPSLTAKAKILP